MTADEFREIALLFAGAEERSHMNHPDFRVGGKVFATLGPDLTWGMAKLTPAQQRLFMTLSPSFTPASGKWGESGSTIIRLDSADAGLVREALSEAWKNLGSKTKK